MKAKLIFLCVVMGLLNLPAFSDETPSVKELLDKYAETQDKQKSFISKMEITDNVVARYPASEQYKYYSGEKKRYETEEVRFDGKQRTSYRRTRWGDFLSGFLPKTDAGYISWLWDDKGNYVRFCTRRDQPDRADFWDPEREETVSRGSTLSLTGFIGTGVDRRIDSLVREAGTVSVRSKTEKVNGVDCYVIDADTKYGKYNLWIDPEHGCNIAKFRYLREGDDLWVKGQVMGPNHKIMSTLEILSFEKIDGVWVPMEAELKNKRNYPPINGIGGNYEINTRHIKRTEMVLNPDHDALGSFVPDDITEGSTVRLYTDPGGTYTWQNGKVIDSEGKVVFEPSGRKSPPEEKEL